MSDAAVAYQQHSPQSSEAYMEYQRHREEESFKKYELSNESLIEAVEHYLRSEESSGDGNWVKRKKVVWMKNDLGVVEKVELEVQPKLTEEGISEVLSTLRMNGLDINFSLNKFDTDQIHKMMRMQLANLYAYLFEHEDLIIIPEAENVPTYNAAIHIKSKIESIMFASLMRAQKGMTLEHIGKTATYSEVVSKSDPEKKGVGGMFNLFGRREAK